jgi:hypothetical protein
MPRNQLTKDEIKVFVLKIKDELYREDVKYNDDPKVLTHKYLNKVLDKIGEYWS